MERNDKLRKLAWSRSLRAKSLIYRVLLKEIGSINEANGDE